ncbi:MAG TPA: NADH-quinone oxidoreductase subunit J [Gammaproteobacteria bacterium]|nr:NADH-quinone oxidoreductase subunit J [Gammaproteobacteria bacterium]
MGFEKIMFYIFAAILVISALKIITARNTVHAALFLVLAFFTTAALWLMLEAEFLAMVLVLVYVGAVMVLFLFVVMMLNVNVDELRAGVARYLPVGAAVAIAIILEMSYFILGGFDNSQFTPVTHGADYSNTRAIGNILYTEYLLAFEIAAVLLLLAIVAAITLTLRRRPNTKFQNPSEQVKVRKVDRLRIIKGMDSEN